MDNDNYDYDAALLRLVRANPSGLHTDNTNSPTFRRHLRDMEKRGVLVSHIDENGWRVYLEAPQDAIDWTGGEDKPADTEASKRAGAIVAQINRGGATGASLHAKLFGEIIAKDGE